MIKLMLYRMSLLQALVVMIFISLLLPLPVLMLVYTNSIYEQKQQTFTAVNTKKFHLSSDIFVESLWNYYPSLGQKMLDQLTLDASVQFVRVKESDNKLFLGWQKPHSTESHENIMYLSKVLEKDGMVVGSLEMAFIRQDVLSSLLSDMALFGSIVALQIFCLVLVISWIYYTKILKPIRQLVQDANQLANQKLDEPFLWEENDEIGILGRTFDKTRLKLKELFDALKQENMFLDAKVQQRTKELEDASRYKSEFLANMSHEIRTPMNAILGLSEMALSDVPKGSGHDKLEKIYESGRLLLGILNDILDFSKIEAGELKLNPQPFYFNRMLDQLKSIFSQTAKNKGISLVFDAPKAFEVVYRGDDLRLRQILTNLIGNALKFTEKGEVRLRVREVSAKDGVCWLSFSIKDTGIGILPQEQERLFHAFSQANTSITRNYGGTGLGLIISQRLVWAMGGSDIVIKSTRGEGSIFSFGLPLHTCSLDEADALFESRIETHMDTTDALCGYVLVVEDNLINQEVVCEQLRRIGMRSKVANNGSQAVSMVKEEHFDAVLMDIQMPIMDGYEAAKRIRVTHPHLPIIALTAAAMIEDRHKAIKVGMNAHLSKPIHAKELKETLRLYVSKTGYQKAPIVTTSAKPPQKTLLLDVNDGLERMGGDKELYVRLLKTFLVQLESEIVPSLHAKKPTKRGKNFEVWEPFRVEVHSLKGIAGNLSLHRLLESATLLDAQIKEKQSAPKSMIDALHVSLRLTKEAIDEWLEKKETT